MNWLLAVGLAFGGYLLYRRMEAANALALSDREAANRREDRKGIFEGIGQALGIAGAAIISLLKKKKDG
jgi:hypothetical protein